MSRFARKIYLGFGITLLALFALATTSYFAMTHVMTAEDALISSHSRELYLAERLRIEKEAQFSLMPVFVLRGDPHILGEFHQARGRFLALLEELLRLDHNPQGTALLKNIQDIEQDLFEKGDPARTMRQRGASAVDVDAYLVHATGPLPESLNQALDQFMTFEQDQFEKARAAAAHTTSKLYWGFITASAIALVLAILSGGLLVNVLRKKQHEDRRRDQVLERETRISIARKESVEMVSHDLRNPLATARMSLEMIADKLAQAKADDALVQDGLQITTRSLSAMETLINNLLDHAKIESGRLTLSHQRCDTDAFLADIELRFAPLAKRRGLRFRVERDRGLPCMYWDSARVEQVLSNLLGNAFKFSPGGTEVVLSARHQDAALLLSVRDQGPGLAPDEANHVFDRYWQARERSHYGQGLGLAIAKAIVTAHKGEIWVVSERGKGSEFLFTIPLTAEALNEASV